jgi:acyl dehydratase
MIKKKFIITQNEGKKFSVDSGDNNKIHLNQNYAYNSIFGKKICFGSLVLIKILKLVKVSFKDNFHLKVSFNQPVFYEIPIYIHISNKKKKKDLIEIYQLNKFIGIIELNKKIFFQSNPKNEIINKKFKKRISKKLIFKKINHKSTNKFKLNNLMMRLSKYVGVYYPGENSLILEIEIFYNKDLNSKKFQIGSFEYDKRFRLINNNMKFGNFLIFFKSLHRPKFDLNKKYEYPEQIKKIINNLKDNILIIGSSQGIGLQFLKLFKINKKIKIFATYNNNKIKINAPNIYKIKLDIRKDFNKLFRIIKKNSPLKIFYFASDKIYFEKKLDNKIKQSYKFFFIDTPLNIVKRNIKDNKILFFYPSTTNISIDKNSYYSKIKLVAEKKLNQLKKKAKMKILLHRFPAIYSRQSINLFNREPISLITYLEKNSNLLKHIVNKNLI